MKKSIRDKKGDKQKSRLHIAWPRQPVVAMIPKSRGQFWRESDTRDTRAARLFCLCDRTARAAPFWTNSRRKTVRLELETVIAKRQFSALRGNAVHHKGDSYAAWPGKWCGTSHNPVVNHLSGPSGTQKTNNPTRTLSGPGSIHVGKYIFRRPLTKCMLAVFPAPKISHKNPHPRKLDQLSKGETKTCL